MYLSYGHFHSTLHWCARDWTTRAGHKKKITQRKFSLETTLRPALINPVIKLEPQHLNDQCQGEKIWLTHSKKVTRTICLKFIFDHKIDILKPGPLISKNKLIRDKRATPRQQIWFQDCIYSDEEGLFLWETAYRMAPRCTKAPSWLSFNFKVLHRRIPTNDFFT